MSTYIDYKYDDKNQVIAEYLVSSDATTKSVLLKKFEYDDKGNIIRRISYEDNGTEIIEDIKYDDDHRIISIKNNADETRRNYYEYDSSDNIILHECFEGSTRVYKKELVVQDGTIFYIVEEGGYVFTINLEGEILSVLDRSDKSFNTDCIYNMFRDTGSSREITRIVRENDTFTEYFKYKYAKGNKGMMLYSNSDGLECVIGLECKRIPNENVIENRANSVTTNKWIRIYNNDDSYEDRGEVDETVLNFIVKRFNFYKICSRL